ncbi:MAG: hypothetical protein ACYTFQ_21515 [Planctomycetota bacterium]
MVTVEIAARFFESLAMTRMHHLSLRGAERRGNLTSFNSPTGTQIFEGKTMAQCCGNDSGAVERERSASPNGGPLAWFGRMRAFGVVR